MDPGSVQHIESAVALIAATPGYREVGEELTRMAGRGKIRFAPKMGDRAHAGLTGTITLGPEPLGEGVLSLAETLVHEHFHTRRQFPLLKTVSFWRGVFTGTPVMREYERPAYRAALDFLRAVEQARPEMADAAAAEQRAVAATFRNSYGAPLSAPGEKEP